jgi:hypothetical protein
MPTLINHCSGKYPWVKAHYDRYVYEENWKSFWLLRQQNATQQNDTQQNQAQQNDTQERYSRITLENDIQEWHSKMTLEYVTW